MNDSTSSWFDEMYLNGTNDTMLQCPTNDFIRTFSIVPQFLYGAVCLVGLCGNTLVIYVVLRFSKMQTVTNMYILNLAIADEFFLIGLPFLITTMSLHNWIFGDLMCKIYLILTSINQFTSSIFLLIMSADRYIAICHPISSPKLRTPFISRIVSITAWTISAIIMIPVYLFSQTTRAPGKVSCQIIWPEELDSPQKTFTLYSFVLGFAIPLVMILVFYCLVIKKLKTVGPKNKSKEKKRSHRKVTKLVLTVIAVYVFCWLPYWVLQMALIFGPESQDRQCQSAIVVFLFLIAGCFSYGNSAMNPILYAFLSDNFKKSFLKACTCAAGKDVNATLHMENSVFPRRQQKQNSEKFKHHGTGKNDLATLCQKQHNDLADDEDGEGRMLVSQRDSTSAMTMTSRSAITMSTDSKDNSKGESSCYKNGALISLQPTQV